MGAVERVHIFSRYISLCTQLVLGTWGNDSVHMYIEMKEVIYALLVDLNKIIKNCNMSDQPKYDSKHVLKCVQK